MDEYIHKIEEAGGKMLMEKQTVPNVGTMAAFEDTEGNVSVIMEPVEWDKMFTFQLFYFF
jgi:predicted enzyme related to lactoylglutathione lyase